MEALDELLGLGDVELELLEPQAATPAATTITVANALMRRSVNLVSFSCVENAVSDASDARVLPTCERSVGNL